MSVPPVPEISGAMGAMTTALDHSIASTAKPTHGNAFFRFLIDGVDGVSDKLAKADNLVRAFTLDDSIPVHQVTYALEEARLSVELFLQVRSRLVEGYQQLMNMQL